jgi:hypothetical protein
MAMTYVGKRQAPDSQGLEPGAYKKWHGTLWLLRTPAGQEVMPPAHSVRENDDGTITIEGEIRSGSFRGRLERGVWLVES